MLLLAAAMLVQPEVDAPEISPTYECHDTADCAPPPDESYATEAPSADAVAEAGADAAVEGAEAAAEWIPAAPRYPGTFVTIMDDGAAIYLRPETAVRAGKYSGGYVDVWFDYRYIDGRQKKRLWRVWCNSRKIAILSWVTYDSNGKLADSGKSTSFSTLSGDDVIPDSYGDTMMQAVCTLS